VYAHRGGAALRPENTIAAFDHGLSLGADGLELDVHLSRDGEVVVHHDPTLERTTNGRGTVANHTADELARLDAGYWFRATASAGTRRARAAPEARDEFPFRGHGHGVPRFADVIARYPGVPLIIELKLPRPELARRTIDVLRAANAVGRASIGSFYPEALDAVRRYEPSVATGAAKEETRWALYRSWVSWPIGRTDYREFQVPECSGFTRIVSRRFVAHVHRAGLAVKVWTVDSEEDIRRLLSWGVDGIISDRPDVAVKVLTELLKSRCR
jgi:glycerophosphoryl diester phosphodiesterase